MKPLINAILQKHSQDGIEFHNPASARDIRAFERRIGFALPEDFKAFYTLCNGFGCNEDLFNMLPLFEIGRYPDNHGPNWFHFAEYMIYADRWGLRLTASGQYEIFNGSYPAIPMTASLTEFLERFLAGNVFDPGGLYAWQEELGIKS